MSTVLSKNRSNSANEPLPSWAARLNCTFEFAGDRTIVRHEHFGPLRIQRPFYPEKDVAHVYFLHPPGGVVGGDKLTINVASESNTAGLITTPGATKYYRTNDQVAEVIHQLESSAGSLEWFPQENIFFPECKVDIASDINLRNAASLAWWDINCFGRGKAEKSFVRGEVSSVMNLWNEGVLLLRERIQVDASFPLSLSSGCRGNPTIGTLILYPVHAESILSVRRSLSNRTQFSVTTFDDLLVVRYLGDSAEQAKNGFIKVWSMLRRELNGNIPCLPRIWAT